MSFPGLGAKPIELTEDRIDRLLYKFDTPERMVIEPYTDTVGINGAEGFFEDLYTAANPGRGAGSYSFEWWFNKQLTVSMTGPDLDDINSLLNSQYPNSRMKRRDEPIPEPNVGHYLSTARLNLATDCSYPLSYTGARGDALDGDPYQSVLPRLVNENDVKLVVQGCFQPVKKSWYKRGRVGDDSNGIAEGKEQGEYHFALRDADSGVIKSDYAEDLASDIRSQSGDPAFRTNIRLLAIGDDPDETQQAVENAANAFKKFDYGDDQKLRPEYFRSTDNISVAENFAQRTVSKRNVLARMAHGPANVLTAKEWGGLFHFPDRSIEVPDVKWITRESGPGVPRESGDFDDSIEIPDDPTVNA